MRSFLIAVFASCLAMAAPAHAQPDATSQVQAAPSEAAMSAARRFMNIILVDSGGFRVAIERSFAQQLPTMRANLQGGAEFRRLSPARQQAVLAFIDTVPQLTTQEIDATMPSVIDAGALEIATLYSEQEMLDIQAFVERPEVKPFIIRGVLDGVNNAIDGNGAAGEPTLSESERAAFDAFEATPSGQAFRTKGPHMFQAVAGVIARGFADVAPRVQKRMLAGMCQAMAEECPPTIRALVDAEQ